MSKSEHKHNKEHSLEHASNKSESCSKSSKYECKCGNCTKLCIGSLAISMGVANGLLVLIIGWVATFCEWGHTMVHALGSVYKGFEPSIMGGICGGIWGFAVGIIYGAILACVYNCCLCCCCHFKCKFKCKSTKNNHESQEHHSEGKHHK